MLNQSEPTPDEMEASLARMARYNSLVFELALPTWTMVRLARIADVVVGGKPELTIIFFKPTLLVATPIMPEFPGHIALTGKGIQNHTCTWITTEGERNIGFRYTNDDALKWLNLQFARSNKMRFREHDTLDKDKVVYTRNP